MSDFKSDHIKHVSIAATIMLMGEMEILIISEMQIILTQYFYCLAMTQSTQMTQ